MKNTTTLPTTGLFALLLSLAFPASGQNHSEKDGAKFYTSVSPYILPKEGIEVNFLNSMTSFWLAANEFNPATQSSRVANRYRFTRFQQLLRLTYGFSESGRWDLGAEAQYTHSRLDDEARSSPFRVLGGDTETGATHRGLSLLGLRLRVLPLVDVPELTAQLTAHFPINRKEESRELLGAQRTQIGLATTYYQRMNQRTFYFLQASWNTHLANDELNRTTHSPSLSGFLVFDVAEQLYAFPGLSYSPTLQQLGSGGSLRRVNQQLLGSLGALYQPTEQLGVMLNWQVPFILESGSANTEWVRESYTGLTLGVRVGI